MMHSNSKERGMIFNSEMVRAILSGQKTQTRRIISDRHIHLIDVASQVGECYPLEAGTEHANSQSYYREHCPFGEPGDRIWVRETHHLDQYGYTYKADGDWIKDMRENGAFRCDEKWTPSMHMKRCASRILLEITNVRVERLNDISEEDAHSEGVTPKSLPAEKLVGGKLAFAELWASIYGYENWQANPWVWVIEFKRVQEQSND